MYKSAGNEIPACCEKQNNVVKGTSVRFLSFFCRVKGKCNTTLHYTYGRIMLKLGVVGGLGAPSVCFCFLGCAGIAGGPQKTC